ncbi:MAG: hypothetical protein M1813_007442 [Trichoglossum hirsutum]|nr:MAG: hypothetical protein M1813_007442 [Trichoglossum hirsutum]
MATLAFIPYVPKVSNPKSTSTSLLRDTPQQSRSFSSHRIAAKEGELPSPRVDSKSGAVVLEPLTEIFKSSNNSIEDAGDTYFPTVEELVSSFRRDRLPELGLSKRPEPQTVDKPPVEKSGHFVNPDKSTSGRNIEGSQEDLESDDTASEADFSDFRADSTKQDRHSLDDLEASSKATTPLNPSPPHHCAVESDASRAAKLRTLSDVETEMTVAENGRNSKRKAREKHRQSELVILDSSTEWESESDVDYKPQQKKQRTDHASRTGQGCSPSRLQVAQYSADQHPAIDDSDLGSRDDIQNLTTELIPPTRQNDESASNEALDIVATLGDGETKMESRNVVVQDGSDTTGQPQARDAFQSVGYERASAAE